MRPLLPQATAAWNEFAASWDDLGIDTYMADGGRYRHRRFSAFSVSAEAIVRKAASAALSKPRLQRAQRRHRAVVSADHGRGCHRRVSARDPAAVLLDFRRPDACPPPPCFMAHGVPPVSYRSAHRSARPADAGRSASRRCGLGARDAREAREYRRGRHVHLRLRTELIGRFTLQHPLDSAFVDDSRAYHGVTPVVPIDPELPAHRDVLVVTLRRE